MQKNNDEKRKKIRLGQDLLETVIPRPGRRVLITGAGSDLLHTAGTLQAIDEENFSAVVALDGPDGGKGTGRKLNIDYEDICKYEEGCEGGDGE